MFNIGLIYSEYIKLKRVVEPPPQPFAFGWIHMCLLYANLSSAGLVSV